MATLTALCKFILSLCLFHANNGIILTSDTFTMMETNTVNITIDTKLNLVDIELSILSTSAVWKAFGFGSNVMLDTYSIILDYALPGETSIVLETTLAQRSIGTVYTVPEITVSSDTNDGTTRTVHIQRPIDGTYSFPTAPTALFNVISAIGQKSNFQRCSGQRQAGCAHVSQTGRSTTTVVLKEVASSPTLQPTAEPSIHPSTSPTVQPSVNPTIEPTSFPTVEPTNMPSVTPSISPTMEPTTEPTVEPTLYPTHTPSDAPSTMDPSLSPTFEPSTEPSWQPTIDPTQTPSVLASVSPTEYPIASPTELPSLFPTFAPTTSDPFTWICDEKSKCRHHVISCEEMNGTYCDLHCVSSTSCQYTIFECPSDMHCNILCEGYKACDSLSVIGRRRGHLNLQCHGDSSCMTANINADHADTLNITCIGEESCNDIALWCPSYILSQGVIIPKCKISGASVSGESAVNKMRIYADNSWEDIDPSSYLPLDAEVEMFCHSDTSQCILQQSNATWDCKDTESQCSVSKQIETTVSPIPMDTTNSYADSTTESTDDQDAEDSFIVITCDERNPCDTDIICNESECHVICNADDSCRSSNIYGTKQNSILSVECNGEASCKGANLFGRDLLYLMVTCSGYEACKTANFYGNNSKLLSIECLDSGGSCQDMNVYCPLDSKGCVVSNDDREGHDIHSNLDFYAVHGFDDLDLSKYDAELVWSEEDNATNMMHCGTHYQSFCVMNSSLFCECVGDEIPFWTPHITVSEIVAMSVSGAVLLSIVGLIGLCVRYNRNRTKSRAKVKKEENAQIEMENKQLMQNSSDIINTIIVECDEDSDQDDEDLVYEDGANSEDIKHPKNSLYRKI
eukprot:54405_1